MSEEEWPKPGSYLYDMQTRINESIRTRLNIEMYNGNYGILGDWQNLDVEEVGVIVPIPDAIYDEGALTKEEYDAKYPPPPPPPPIPFRKRWRTTLGSYRFSWGLKIGSWIAGEDLGKMIYDE